MKVWWSLCVLFVNAAAFAPVGPSRSTIRRFIRLRKADSIPRTQITLFDVDTKEIPFVDVWNCRNLDDPYDIKHPNKIVRVRAALIPTARNSNPVDFELDSDPLARNYYDSLWKYDVKNLEAHFASPAARMRCLYERPISLNDMRISLVHGRCAHLLYHDLFEEYAIRWAMQIFGVSRRIFSNPDFTTAVPNVCYQSLDQRHPSCVALFKKDDTLHLIHVSNTQYPMESSHGAMADMLVKLNFTDEPSFGGIKMIFARMDTNSVWQPVIANYTDRATSQLTALNAAPWLKDLQRYRNAFNVTYIDFDIRLNPFINGKQYIVSDESPSIPTNSSARQARHRRTKMKQ